MNLNTQRLIEIVGVVAVVVSLTFVGFELRMNREVALNESFGTSIETSTDMLSFISIHPAIWRKGCSEGELSEDEDLIFGALVRALDRYYFFRYMRSVNGITSATPENYVRAVAIIRSLNPGFNTKWLEMAEYVGINNEWPRLVEENYANFNAEYIGNMTNSGACGTLGI